MEPPKVIFLDAVGTLFGVRGSVGEIYSAIARKIENLEVSPEVLDLAFYQSFKASPPLAFAGNVEPDKIPQLEFDWWEAIAVDTFTRAGAIEGFDDFKYFFQELYAYFATSKPWYVYPEVLPTLTKWQKNGIKLGIISNFDTRIYQVIENLKLEKLFSTITISSIVGAAKPNSKIFSVALHKHNLKPKDAWHIGDSLKEDYDGAKAVGIRSFLLRRI